MCLPETYLLELLNAKSMPELCRALNAFQVKMHATLLKQLKRVFFP